MILQCQSPNLKPCNLYFNHKFQSVIFIILTDFFLTQSSHTYKVSDGAKVTYGIPNTSDWYVYIFTDRKWGHNKTWEHSRMW